ncbi:MAG TPA: methyltransferase domain-containing protein [Gaiellaceae bacterium]|jgi:SAM-dependent methyltransferase|nr:methyltransferase domain-containing protein [Gaiellaceae bacterium]
MPGTPRRLTFGENAASYERARPAWPEQAARWLVPADARLVVELGAGTGKLTRALAAVVPRVLAVEPDPRMLSVLREQGHEGTEGSAEAIPLGDGEADAVVAGSCIHWFDLEPALAEVHRVLRPGGRFAFGWNHRDARHPGVARMQERIYAARPEGTGWRSRDWPAEVTAAGLFRDVEHELFEHVHALPRAALRDHLLSYATLASLPEDEREAAFAGVVEILDSEPSLRQGERLTLPFVVDAYRATAVASS